MTITTKVAPDFLYYALVDGTSEVDSVAFAANLTVEKGFGGWRNLLNFLGADPYDDTRLIDPGHTYLPIIKMDARGRPHANGAAVMCPGGPGGRGKEESWKAYKPTPKTWILQPSSMEVTIETVGRHTAAEESAEMVADFLLSPAVQVDPDGFASISSGPAVKPDAKVFRASLLYVSSHGWLGGFMAGEQLHPWDAAEPANAKKKYSTFHSYFLIGRADFERKYFVGPRWIVLAQCSTLNSATWAMWARVMANSDPPVHGILGYEESSPAAGASVGIAERFFAALKSGKSFLEAWKSANPGQHWAAIVHKDAHEDRMKPTFPSARLSKPAIGDYIGYLQSERNKGRPQSEWAGGRPISDSPAPFKVQLFRSRSTKPPIEVTPDTLDCLPAVIFGGGNYLVRVSSAQPFTHATIRFVHIRESYDTQFGHAQIFEKISSPNADATFDLRSPRDVKVIPASPATEVDVKFKFVSDAKLSQAGLRASHSYLWLEVWIQLASGAQQHHQFKTLGLLYG